MSDPDSTSILYHRRRRNEERQRAFMAEHPHVREAHLQLSYLHDLAEVLALGIGTRQSEP